MENVWEEDLPGDLGAHGSGQHPDRPELAPLAGTSRFPIPQSFQLLNRDIAKGFVAKFSEIK